MQKTMYYIHDLLEVKTTIVVGDDMEHFAFLFIKYTGQLCTCTVHGHGYKAPNVGIESIKYAIVRDKSQLTTTKLNKKKNIVNIDHIMIIIIDGCVGNDDMPSISWRLPNKNHNHHLESNMTIDNNDIILLSAYSNVLD